MSSTHSTACLIFLCVSTAVAVPGDLALLCLQFVLHEKEHRWGVYISEVKEGALPFILLS